MHLELNSFDHALSDTQGLVTKLVCRHLARCHMVTSMRGDYRQNYDLLDSIGIMSSLFSIVNSICPFCILLCIYTFYYVLTLDNIRNCILLF